VDAVFGQLSCPSAPVYVHISTSGMTTTPITLSDMDVRKGSIKSKRGRQTTVAVGLLTTAVSRNIS